MDRRNASKAARIEVLEDALRGMFKKLERRPIPGHIGSIVDQLQFPEAPAFRKTSVG